jgi:short-subunit dehydrogenase
MNGLVPTPLLGIYNASKHAVVSISETLHFELAMSGTNVKVSVLCPGAVQTRIKFSERNRPSMLVSSNTLPLYGGDPSDSSEHKPGMSPAEVAEQVLRAVENEQFYIFTHSESLSHIEVRMNRILNQQNPVCRETRVSRALRMRAGGPQAASVPEVNDN